MNARTHADAMYATTHVRLYITGFPHSVFRAGFQYGGVFFRPPIGFHLEKLRFGSSLTSAHTQPVHLLTHIYCHSDIQNIYIYSDIYDV